MKTVKGLILGLALAGLTLGASAQTRKASPQDAGWYGGLSFGVSHDDDGWQNELGTTFGYDMDRHWSAETGMPLYFVSPSDSVSGTTATTTNDSYVAAGDAFARLKFDPKWSVARYNTSFTVTAPTGSRTHGTTSGHATWSWDNKIEKDFWRISPYLQGSLANSLANTASFQRAFTTYGFISQQKAGLSFELTKHFSLDANYYNVAPLADQTVYSRIVKKGNSGNGNGNAHGRAFEDQPVTSGTSSLTKDHGFGAGISASPTKNIEWSFDYNHSVGYQLDTVSTTLAWHFGHGYNGAKK